MSKEKIVDWETIKREVALWRSQGLRIVFTNGCFDLLHVGHVRYLQEAKKLGDKLIIGLNSDYSVRQIKGSSRPINPQDHRGEVLAALECVDRIVIFDEPTPLRLITHLEPDVLVKGADWKEEDIVGREVVLGRRGAVRRIALTNGISTTEIIKKILERYRGKVNASYL